MPKNLSQLVLKGAAGFLVGLALWWGLSGPYTQLLAALSEPLIRLTERPPVTQLVPKGAEMTIERTDFPPSSARPALRVTDLTFNLILLVTLFAASPGALSDRNVFRFFGACAALVVVHVVAIVVNVQSIYALRLGPWSRVHYGAIARNFWGTAAHFYTVVGVFAAALVLWWLFLPDDSPDGPHSKQRAARGSRKR